MKSEHRHELAENDLSKFLARWGAEFDKHANTILSVLIVVALVAAGVIYWTRTTAATSAAGWTDLTRAGTAEDYQNVAEDYAGTPVALWATLRAGAEQVAERALGVLADFNLMEVADPTSEWVGRSLADIAAERGTDVIDVLIDVVLPDKLTLYLVLPSLTPSLGRSDEGWAKRVEVWKDPRVMLGGSDAGAHLDLMCHANYPTVVLGEVVRDRGLHLVHAILENDPELGR